MAQVGSPSPLIMAWCGTAAAQAGSVERSGNGTSWLGSGRRSVPVATLARHPSMLGEAARYLTPPGSPPPTPLSSRLLLRRRLPSARVRRQIAGGATLEDLALGKDDLSFAPEGGRAGYSRATRRSHPRLVLVVTINERLSYADGCRQSQVTHPHERRPSTTMQRSSQAHAARSARPPDDRGSAISILQRRCEGPRHRADLVPKG